MIELQSIKLKISIDAIYESIDLLELDIEE